MNGREVMTADGHKLGHVVADTDDWAVVERGMLRKTRHAIPRELLHEAGGELRATVGRDVVESSPGPTGGAFDRERVLTHYGLIGPTVVDPDPDGLDSAETAGARAGVEPEPSKRLATLGGENDPSVERPAVFDRTPSGVEDAGADANLH